MNFSRPIELMILLIVFSAPMFREKAPTASQAGKVVFLKKDDVVTAKNDGTDVRVLTSDSVPKRQPVWSPDGRKIAYVIAGTKASNPKSHAQIVIIDSTGARQTGVPVLSTEADGTFVEGLRSVEEIGWYGNGSVFAIGTLNPYLAEYRILDVSSSKVIQSYFGYGFASCAGEARVAYVAESEGAGSKGIHIELQGTPVYSAAPGTTLRGLQWSTDCQRLAFFQVDGANTRLVLLHSADHSLQVEADLPLRKDITNPMFIPLADSFLLRSDSASLVYEGNSRSLQPALGIADEVQKLRVSRDLLMHQLGGRSPDWWEPRPE
jgi:hypothetical protein